MPSEEPAAGDAWEEQDGGASAVPASVADSMRQYVAALTTPESELEQQVQEVVRRWAARHESAEAGAAPGAASPSNAAADADAHCLNGSSVSNSRSASPSWSGSSGSDAAAPPAPPPPPAAGDAGGSSGSGRSSEERSAAWQLCTFMQRCGWPLQHCASVRAGGGAAAAAAGADGWRASSGHEFLLLFPPSSGGGGRGRSGGAGNARGASSDASSGGGSSDDAEMADTSAALVIDPLFAAQFALASPTPRYQVVLSLLPRVFVGTYDRLHRLVEWVCCEMQGSFHAGEGGLPPWRSVTAMLNKWRLTAEDGEEEAAPEGQAAQPQSLGWGSAGGGASPALGTAGTAAAFTEQQQESMRALLLHPAAAAALPAGGLAQALTASSSCSSMDILGSGVGQGPNASSGGVSTPRSMLTQELAAAGAKRQHAQQQGPPPQRQHLPAGQAAQQEGPAAAILSLLGRSHPQHRSV